MLFRCLHRDGRPDCQHTAKSVESRGVQHPRGVRVRELRQAGPGDAHGDDPSVRRRGRRVREELLRALRPHRTPHSRYRPGAHKHGHETRRTRRLRQAAEPDGSAAAAAADAVEAAEYTAGGCQAGSSQLYSQLSSALSGPSRLYQNSDSQTTGNGVRSDQGESGDAEKGHRASADQVYRENRRDSQSVPHGGQQHVSPGRVQTSVSRLSVGAAAAGSDLRARPGVPLRAESGEEEEGAEEGRRGDGGAGEAGGQRAERGDLDAAGHDRQSLSEARENAENQSSPGKRGRASRPEYQARLDGHRDINSRRRSNCFFFFFFINVVHIYYRP